MRDNPRLTWLGGKTYPQANSGRAGVSGHKQEHGEALIEDASRSLAKEIEKAVTRPQLERPEETV